MEAPPRALAALTVSLLPPWPALPAVSRREIEAEVIGYVDRQVSRMPLFLRLPYLGVLVIFSWGAAFRYGRPFAQLAARQRQAWVNLWAQSPVVPMRDFVRLVRSCALLAWFDHPTVSVAMRAQQQDPV